MIKLVTLLVLATVVWTIISVRQSDTKLISSFVETAPTAAPTSTPSTLGLATSSAEISTWKTHIEEKLGFRLKYPEGVQIKRNPDGSVQISKGDLNISITQIKLPAKDTVNTIAEQDINTKLEKGDPFKLIETISPIAISSQTGITYTTEEDSREITYFYLPHGFNFLKIVNKTVENKENNLISLSDEIIYSLELVER